MRWLTFTDLPTVMNKSGHIESKKTRAWLKGRIDYLLGTPSLEDAISDAIFHEDFAPPNRGLSVFRAHSALLKNPGYKSLIDNTIRFNFPTDLTKIVNSTYTI